MSIRVKVFLIIIGIVVIITASSVVISISSAQSQILKTLESDMELVASLANEYISGEIDLLKANASSVAQILKTASAEKMQQVLMEQVAAYQEYFMAVTVFNKNFKIDASYGAAYAPESIAESFYGEAAFDGMKVISTTQKNEATGQVVFYILVPMDDYYIQSIIGDKDPHPRIVVCTVPGSFFSQRVNRFLIWETGNIIIVDEKGTIVANVQDEWVNEQINFIELSEKDYHYNDIARAMTNMISSDKSGTDRYVLDHVDAVIAFSPITASEQHWTIAVIAPIAESPFFRVQFLIAISGVIFLALGVIAAALASRFIAKPFYQIRAQNVELIRLGEAAKAASKTKSAFLANMSHEMRTPLNTILGLSETILKKEGLQKDVGICLEKIYGAGSTLMEVVTNLLDISNMESDKFELINNEYNVSKFINDVINANTIHIGPKPIKFDLILGENIPARLFGDELRIKQIFNNLLSNAFTFTKEGSVEWKISTEKEKENIWLISTVTDTGAGIKPEDIDKLFSDYKHLDTKKEFNKEGAGLGLALTKRMIDLMDGTITVESIYGKGSAFTVKIRQKPVDHAVISAETAENLKKFKYTQQKRIEDSEK